jgi:hypothetical protein
MFLLLALGVLSEVRIVKLCLRLVRLADSSPLY